MGVDRTNPESVRESPPLIPNSSLIKNLRKTRGLTQLELACLADVSERTIRRAETGQPVRMQSIKLIATALGAEFLDLIDDEQHFREVLATEQRVSHLLEALRIYSFERNFDPFLDMFHSTALLEITGPPEIPFTGDYRGIENIKHVLCEVVPATIGYVAPTVFESVRGSGNLVILSGYDKVRILETDKVVEGWWQHIYQFEEGKIDYAQELFDTNAFLHGFINEAS